MYNTQTETGKLFSNIKFYQQSYNICNCMSYFSLILLTFLHIQHGGHKTLHRFCYNPYQEQNYEVWIYLVSGLSYFYIHGCTLNPCCLKSQCLKGNHIRFGSTVISPLNYRHRIHNKFHSRVGLLKCTSYQMT
jgi:hypothetical protein